MQDKRKFRRLPVDATVPCRVFQDGKLIDLSIGGAFVLTDRPLPHGCSISLELPLPGLRTIRVRTTVERVGDYFEGTSASPALGMGLRFVDMDPEDRIALTRFLRTVHEHATEGARVAARLRARVRSGESWLDGTVREVGERMIFLETDAVEPIGAEVDFIVRLPNAHAPIDARGTVLEVENGGDAHPRGLRLELSEVGPHARALLDAFLAEAREERARRAGAE